MKGIAPASVRKTCAGREMPVPHACSSSCTSSDSDMVCSVRDDSDSSDCTCDIDNLTQEEDSGRFSADFSHPTTNPIIAPPSPFVTRTEKAAHQRHLEDRHAALNHTRDPPLKKEALRHAVLCSESGSNPTLKREAASNQIKRFPPLSESEAEQQHTRFSSHSNASHQSIAHPASKIPICKSCVKREKPLFNTDCQACWAFFKMKEATPSHVFAILRLWIPEVQKNIESLVKMALLLGCGIQDRDAVTDMTLLHYAVKAGTHGIGDPLSALRVISLLLKEGADPCQRCKWTSMTALHYAAYFDVPEALEFILRCPEGVPIDDPCPEYDNGTALHIAAANLSEGAFKVLLRHGACPWVKDNLGRTPHECIPSAHQFKLVPGLQEIILRMQGFLLRQRLDGVSSTESGVDHPCAISGRAILKTIGLKIGDRVLIEGTKTATLKYAGPTEFATGLWAGVELESPEGRHDGTVKGVVYFRCAKKFGMFVPINRLTKIPNLSSLNSSSERESRLVRVAIRPKVRERRSSVDQRRSLSLPPRRVNHGKVDISKVTSKVAQDIRNDERKIVLGDRVSINMGAEALGVVRFTGAVHFASGFWIGVDLEEAIGSNDGSVCGTRYFLCRRQHGTFAVSSRVTKINDSCEDNWYRGASMQKGRSTSSTSHLHSNPLESELRHSFTSSSSSFSTPFLVEEEGIIPSGFHKVALYPTNTLLSNLNRCFSGRYISSRRRQQEVQRQKEEKAKEPQWQEPLITLEACQAKRQLPKQTRGLEVGQTVFYRNKFGIVRFIGRVHFADGTWLGVELRQKSGRNDGTVKGRRYFSCRRGYGVMVPPHKVTVHGLNGAQLLKHEWEEEDAEQEGNLNNNRSSPDTFLML